MQVDELDRAAVSAGQAEKLALTARALIRHGRHQEAEQSASDAATAAGTARLTLEQMGAAIPEGVVSAPIPLQLLDVDEARRLLEVLERALPLADALDARRGRTIELRGERRGSDVRSSLGLLVSRLQLEVYGPAVAVTGGRE